MSGESRTGAGMTSARTRERLIGRLREQGIRDEETLAALSAVPRHLFVDEALASRAYEDTALPIGHGQTISQPYIVARMTAALRTSGPLERVLEIGTGSGYQAAVLAPLAGHLYTVERIAGLVRAARQRFQMLRLTNITVRAAAVTMMASNGASSGQPSQPSAWRTLTLASRSIWKRWRAVRTRPAMRSTV